MRFSNLPLDYFTGVLPTSQFGSESVVNLNLGSASGSASISGSTGDASFSPFGVLLSPIKVLQLLVILLILMMQVNLLSLVEMF